jgi:hypothetical protein
MFKSKTKPPEVKFQYGQKVFFISDGKIVEKPITGIIMEDISYPLNQPAYTLNYVFNYHESLYGIEGDKVFGTREELLKSLE